MNHLTDENIQNYVVGMLDSAERADVRQHIEHCSECRDNLMAFQEVFTLLEDETEFELSKNFTKKVLKQTHKIAIGSVQFGLMQLFFVLASFMVVIIAIQNYVQVDKYVVAAENMSMAFRDILTIIASAFKGLFDNAQFDGFYIALIVLGLFALFAIDRFILQPRFRVSAR